MKENEKEEKRETRKGRNKREKRARQTWSREERSLGEAERRD